MTVPALWTKHKPLAVAIASGYSLPGAERQDLEQEALIGLWIAAGKWRPDGEASFRTFAALVIRRRLSTLVKAAMRSRQRALNESLRVATSEDGVDVLIVDLLPGGRDPLEIVVARDVFERVCVAARGLSAVELEALERSVAGEPLVVKRLDNGLTRARRKLREAAWA